MTCSCKVTPGKHEVDVDFEKEIQTGGKGFVALIKEGGIK